MLTAVRQRAVVMAGGLIQITAPELEAGTVADVLVIVQASSRPRIQGQGSLASPAEADAFQRSEREPWRS
jgi:hypothetical protein